MKKIFLLIILLFPVSICALEYPKLNSKKVEVYDLTDKKILYKIKSTENSPIASLTKIATIITAIETIENLDEKVMITEEILKTVSADASNAGLKAGDIVTYKDLLYATMLPSGADGANSVAILSSGSIENFINKMNFLVKKIGLKNTNFVNATGFDENNHYSTIDDIVKLLAYSLKNKVFKEIYTTKEYTLSNGLVVKSTIISNYYSPDYDTNKIVGSKTGYTIGAGYCLSSLSKINNHEILIVVLNATKDDNKFYNVVDTFNIINFIEENYKERTLIRKNEHIKNIKVNLSDIDNYEIKASKDITQFLPNNYDKTKFKVKYIGKSIINFTYKKGDEIGVIKYYYDDKLIYEENAILDKNIKLSIIKVVKTYWYIILALCLLPIYFLCNNKFYIRWREKYDKKN